MRIALFTSNQRRHLSLIHRLAAVADELFVVQECNTVFPGEVDDFFRKSAVMQDYFRRVMDAEQTVFGDLALSPPNVRSLAVKLGDVSKLPLGMLDELLTADAFVVFGASYIRGPLCNVLVDRRAINIHMGVSPFYRGSSTNFWALYDEQPEYIGATLHLLTSGLDSGPILRHVLPAAETFEPFELGMRAVEAAHAAVADGLASGELLELSGIAQDKALQIRYTRNADFTDVVAAEYLEQLMTPDEIAARLRARNVRQFVRPFMPAAAQCAETAQPVRV